jgi:hypothetical protein
MSRRQAYNTAITSRGLRPYLNAQRSVHAEFQAGIAVVRFVGDVGDGSSDGKDSNGDGEAEEVEDKEEEEEEEEEDDDSDGDVGEDEARTWRYAVWKWALLVLAAILLSLSLLAVGRTLRSPSTARTVTTIERVCWQLVSTTAYSYGYCIKERMMFATFHADELEESERRGSGAEYAKTAGYEAGPEPEPEPAKKRGVGGERKQGRCVESGTVVLQFPREIRQMVIDQVCYVSDTMNDSGGGEGREERIAIVGRLVS